MQLLKRLLLAVALVVAPAGLHAAESRVPATEWTCYDWNASTGGSAARFERIGIADRPLLQVTAPFPDDARFVGEAAVEPDTVYRFSCRLRTEKVGTAGRGAGISVLGMLDGSPGVTGSSGWRTEEFYGRTGPDQRKVSVTVGIGGYGSLNSGAAWFDQVEVEKATAVPPGIRVAQLEPAAASAAKGAGSSGGTVVAVAGLFGLLLVAAGLFLRRTGSLPEKRTVLPSAAPGTAPNRRDIAAIAALTTAVLALSLWSLGDCAAPGTGWTPARAGETVTVELGRRTELSGIAFFGGINARERDGARFELSARTGEGSFAPVGSFANDNPGSWRRLDAAVATDAVRITAMEPGARLNEIAFIDKATGRPLTGLRIGETQTSATDGGSPQNLIDEQAAIAAPSFRSGFYFDEIYHARTAYELLHGIDPYETTHPPLGKEIIAAGIALFGMNPFGWRVAGALFGAALVPLAWLFGLKLFRSRFHAWCAALLMAFDFMRFTQSRVALIDVYGVFFVLLMYYFILDLFPAEGETPRRPERSILLAGLAFGIGAACKWIALYAGGGILLLVLLRTALDLKRKVFSGSAGGFLARRAGLCAVAFGVIPAAIYLAAYLPYLAFTPPGEFLASVVRLQGHMLNYHRTLHATHPFSSPWWSWPLDLRPMWIYGGDGLPAGRVSTIASFGNPAIWWLAIPAVATTAVLAIRRRDPRLGVILAAAAFQYLPWVGIDRLAFIYHFWSVVPFVILCIVAVLQAAEEKFPGARAAAVGYLALAGGLFVLFYPVLSGLEVSGNYVALLKWLPTWTF